MRKQQKSKRKSLKSGFMLSLICLILAGGYALSGDEKESPLYDLKYAGEPYVEINNNIPYFTDAEKQNLESFEEYSALDSLGRCGCAYAIISRDTMPTKERGEIGNVRPSGWHTVKYNDLIDGNYLYNRCHLIGYQLAGENANEKNLITGTRYLNVIGMLPFENKVADYVDNSHNHVLYRVTPIFQDRNLVAQGVQMEAWSVEDAGEGVCYNVYCFNVQPGITIDYKTGDSYRTDEEKDSIVEKTKQERDLSNEQTYILNTNTKRIHVETCSSVKDIAPHNKKECSGSLERAMNMGYVPCKRCLD